MNFFKVLLNPEQEERELGERVLVCQAANVLQVGEFQFLQLAFYEWFGRDLPEALVSRMFSRYMMHNEVPHWARHYARLILVREGKGMLDSNLASYHRYDHDYATQMPKGARQFAAAAGIVIFTLAAAILAASMYGAEPTSLLPPYFERTELPAEPGVR
jgi:hypothetical protein